MEACSFDPLSGFFRDGCCHTNAQDHGTHGVCARVTADFLAYSLAQGNDLMTPRPEYRKTSPRFSYKFGSVTGRSA